MSLIPSFFNNDPFGDFGSDDLPALAPFTQSLRQPGMWNDMLANRGLRGGNLRTEMTENEKCFTLQVDVPGLSKKEVKLEVDNQNNTLTVTGEHKESSKGDNERVHWSERSYGRCSRTLRLPRGVDANRISAQQAEGVLSVVIPKVAGRAQTQGNPIQIK